jgi:phosphopantetheine adenylyltransferase
MNSLVKSLILPFLTEVDSLDKGKTVGLFGGGFQPPTKGHFEVVKKAIKMYPNLDKFIIYVGTGGDRSNITQDQSLAIWNIYKTYLPNNVEIEASSNPISSAYRYTREHPFEDVKWFLGSRQGNEQDFKSFEKHSTAPATRNNLEVINIITTGDISDVSGTKTRQILTNKELLFNYLPNELTDEEKDEVFNILASVSENEEITTWQVEEQIQGDSIVCDDCGWTWKIEDGGNDLYICHKCDHDNTPKQTNNFFEPLESEEIDFTAPDEDRVKFYEKYYKNLSPSDFKVEKQKDKVVISNISKKKLEHNPEFKKLLISLTAYMMDQISIDPLPNIKFIEDDTDNANELLGKTAYYDPNTQTIVLYTYNRHPKDILRSYAHEMIHHMQNLEGRINNIKGDNINEDEYLAELELEAYSKGNMLFRSWENNLKND